MTDFIEIYDNALSKDFCKALIRKFEADKKEPGLTGQGLNPVAKTSQDINITYRQDWEKEHEEIANITLNYMIKYMRKYFHLLVGPIQISVPDPVTGKTITINDEIIQTLDDETYKLLIPNVYRLGTINLQKYKRGKGHYSHWHSEIYPAVNDPSCTSLHRVLTFMYYLNDVNEGGETEIYYYNRKLKPTQGQMVIKPAGFTHTHKGNIPRSNDKYILTSWILYQTSEYMYG